MSRKRYTAEQIIGMLREAEVLLSQGQKVGEVSRRLGITDQTPCLNRPGQNGTLLPLTRNARRGGMAVTKTSRTQSR